MNISKLIDVINKRGITCFNYLIHLDNLKSILIYDSIKSRNFLESRNIKFHEISKEEYKKNRRDNFQLFFPNEDVHDYVPLYISSHTPLIKKYANPNKIYYAILKIRNNILRDPKLKRNKIKFSNQNINQITLKNLQIKNITDFNTESDLNDFCRWNLFNDKSLPINDEDRLFKSAEILIPKLVHRKYIIKICLKTKQQEKIYRFLKYKLENKWFEKIESLIDFYNEDFKFGY